MKKNIVSKEVIFLGGFVMTTFDKHIHSNVYEIHHFVYHGHCKMAKTLQ